MHENELAKIALDIAFKIHTQYGPGLFESVYEKILCHEWAKTGIPFLTQQPIPLVHEELKLDAGFRADIILDGKVILELKSVEALAPIHHAQLLTYLKLTGIKLGLLINFNTVHLKDGIHRIANRLSNLCIRRETSASSA
jgi:GxxExxY protein